MYSKIILFGEEKDAEYFWLSVFIYSAVIIFVSYFYPTFLPWGAFGLLRIKGSVGEWFQASYWLLAWGFGVTFIASVASLAAGNDWVEVKYAEERLLERLLMSVWAGVVEEICHRWIIFLAAIPIITVGNYLIFGFLGFGVGEFFQVHISGPVANFFTLGILKEFLADPGKWAIGAAILSSNASFRNGHKYLGWFGFINSWFIGMFFFSLMFRFGLPAAIVIHFFYDALIFTIQYIGMVIERAGMRAY